MKIDQNGNESVFLYIAVPILKEFLYLQKVEEKCFFLCLITKYVLVV